MGIETRIVRRYGRDYWDENKKKILKKMNKHGALEAQDRVAYPSKLKRYMRRHSDEFTAKELRKAGILEDAPEDV
jgi:hypothetical protein